jgi:hypothetical protein
MLAVAGQIGGKDMIDSLFTRQVQPLGRLSKPLVLVLIGPSGDLRRLFIER